MPSVQNMTALTTADIVRATGGSLISHAVESFSGASIDSRTIEDGELFFALRGEHGDGHSFVADALRKGSGAVVDQRPEKIPPDRSIILVKDVLLALQDLAHFLRMKQDIPLVGITGSNGKTTTKEMVCAILSQRFKVLGNEGNLNNHIGLPLSLLRLAPDTEVAVLEMGMNAPGEIGRLCEIARPSHGLITNIGAAHVGRLGSLEAVRNAKLELLDGICEGVFNGDDHFLMVGIDKAHKTNVHVTTFSVKAESDVRARDVQIDKEGSSFLLDVKNVGTVPLRLRLHGLFNIYNALGAAAVSLLLGSTLEDVRYALENMEPFPMRFQVIQGRNLTVVNDSYNANPSSVEEALQEVIRMGRGRRVVVILGDMLELDAFAEEEHRRLGRTLASAGVDVFMSVGDLMNHAARECERVRGQGPVPAVYSFRDVNEAGRTAVRILKSGDMILIKGSRAVGMEKIIRDLSNVI